MQLRVQFHGEVRSALENGLRSQFREGLKFPWRKVFYNHAEQNALNTYHDVYLRNHVCGFTLPGDVERNHRSSTCVIIAGDRCRCKAL